MEPKERHEIIKEMHREIGALTRQGRIALLDMAEKMIDTNELDGDLYKAAFKYLFAAKRIISTQDIVASEKTPHGMLTAFEAIKSSIDSEFEAWWKTLQTKMIQKNIDEIILVSQLETNLGAIIDASHIIKYRKNPTPLRVIHSSMCGHWGGYACSCGAQLRRR